MYKLLFDAAADTLKAYGEKYLGGMLGFTSMLHILRLRSGQAWGQTMEEHIHLHAIVTGGAFDGEAWRPSKQGFLFPVVEMSQDFRDQFCQGLLKLYQDGELALIGKAAEVDAEALVEEMQAKDWEVFIKAAFDNADCPSPEQIYEYLGRYVYKTAISNYRIVDISGRQVSFTYYDNADKRHPKEDGVEKVMTLDAFEFADKRHPLALLAARTAAPVSPRAVLWPPSFEQAQDVGADSGATGVGVGVAGGRGAGVTRVGAVDHGRGSPGMSVLRRGADAALSGIRGSRPDQVDVLGVVGSAKAGESGGVRECSPGRSPEWPTPRWERCAWMGVWRPLRRKTGRKRAVLEEKEVPSRVLRQLKDAESVIFPFDRGRCEETAARPGGVKTP